MRTAIDDAYREQIRRCARSLAVAQNGDVAAFLPSAKSSALVDAFTAGNLDKRTWKLGDQLEFLRDEFPQLDEWIGEYIHTVPLQAYDVGTSDSVHFLEWVHHEKTLSLEQIDLGVCHVSRVAVEETARSRRMAHVRFQDVLSAAPRLAGDFGANDALWIHLNPIRVPAMFRTAILLDDEADLPADVLFFPVGSDVRTAVAEPAGGALIAALEQGGPCRLTELIAVLDSEVDLDRDEITDLCRDLAEMGLVAFG